MVPRKIFTIVSLLGVLLRPYVAAYASEAEHPETDVFAVPPPAADASEKPACRVARTYVERVNAGRYGDMAELFSADAVFLTPLGKVIRGRDEIRAFYAGLLGKLLPTVVPISFIADGQECVMELAATLRESSDGRYRLSAIDHFTVDVEGRIRHMIVYLRPEAQAQTRHHP